MAEGEVLLDAIGVSGVNGEGAPEAAPAFGPLGFAQVAPARPGAQYFAAGRDLEAFGGRFLGLDAFRTSHKSIRFLSKERAI